MPPLRRSAVLGVVVAMSSLLSQTGCGGGCPVGQVNCGGQCVDKYVDSTNCGACGTVCPDGQVCRSGACSETCATGYTACTSGGAAYCANLQGDTLNCGSCGNACATGQVCNGKGQCAPACGPGQCAASCPTGQTACGAGTTASYCANLDDDPFNCGVCGTVCGFGQVCAKGACLSFPAAPQVITFGGPVLQSPKIVPILFSNDNDLTASVTQIKAFYQAVGSSSYWTPLTEYGVGTAQPVNPVTLAEAAPTTIDDGTPDGGVSALQSWLVTKISSAAVPAPDSNTLYAINYPTTTTVTGDGQTSCVDYGGYHNDFANGATSISYAVIPRCTVAGSSDLDIFTETASHELVEGSTDPLPNLSPAYTQADTNHLFWDEANSGSEIGDMCQGDPEAYQQLPGLPFVVQRFWSNQAANAGHDPCVPEYTGGVYFNAVPVLPDIVPFDYGGPQNVEGVKIAVGSSKTIPLMLYSDDPSAGSWTVTIYDANAYYTSNPALLALNPASATGRNGDVINLTITVNTAGGASNGQPTNTELFLIQSSQGIGANQIVHWWYGLVGN